MKRRATTRLQMLTRTLVNVQETERRKLSRELHDRVGQNLTALDINLDMLLGQWSGNAPDPVRARLEDSIALVRATAEAIEDVMAELRPPLLDEYGLLAALREYAREFSQRTHVDVTVRGDEPPVRPLQEVEVTLFRIAQEALTNVAKHARAARVDVDLTQEDIECALIVTDDGVGFDAAVPAPSASRYGRGMTTMRERAGALGGVFEVTAAPGGGTRIAATIPC